jgi:hypothetical protein
VRAILLAGIAAAAIAVQIAGAAGPRAPEVDVSSLRGPQTNATIAVDPVNDQILLAGSNSLLEGTPRIYSSTDGGATWQTAVAFPPPRSVRTSCSSDPGVAIDRRGRQYYSFVRSSPCRSDGVYRVYVEMRPDATSRWSPPRTIAPLGRARLDDKPAIAADRSPVSRYRNRVYVAWTRLSRTIVASIVISHSVDGGRTWSRPVKVNRIGSQLTYASIGVSRSGIVYVAWTDVENFGISIARSSDGGNHFGPEQKVAAFPVIPIPHCGMGIVIPAEPRSCIQANPSISVDTSGGRYSGRVYVSYTAADIRGDHGATLTIFDSKLRAVSGYPIKRGSGILFPQPLERPADQFWTQSAVDPSNGALWVCYYDTHGDPTRTKVHYSCTVSRDGGKRWARQVRAASVASDETQKDASYQYGYYQGLAVANGVAHPIWTDTRMLKTLGEEIYTTRLTADDFAKR